MSHMLIAWTESAADTVMTDLQPAVDPQIPQTNGHIIPTEQLDLVQVVAMATNLDRARITSPSIRQINPAYVVPHLLALVPGNLAPIMDLWSRPFRLPGREEITVEGQQTSGGAQRITVGAWLRDRYVPPPAGESYRIRYTSSTAMVANAWTTLSVTYETSLLRGKYAIIGGEHKATNGQFFRTILDGQLQRPGGLCIQTLGQISPARQFGGGYGSWGTFDAQVLPQIEVLGNGTNADHEGYLEVVRIG